MKYENVKSLLKILNESNYEDVFGALLLYERGGFPKETGQELVKEDIEVLEEFFHNNFMKSKVINSLLHEGLMEEFDSFIEERENYYIPF